MELGSLAQRITEDIQLEFSRRVLRPAIAQREIERMTRDMVMVYLSTLQSELNQIQAQYQIPQTTWENYLDDFSMIAMGGKSQTTPLTLKTLYVSTTASGIGTTINIVNLIRNQIARVGTQAAIRNSAATTGKALSSIAVKTGAKASAKLGTKLLGPVILVGVIAWDVCDHHHHRKVDEPILRANMRDYLKELHAMLLNSSETSMLSVIDEIDISLHKTLSRQKSQSR